MLSWYQRQSLMRQISLVILTGFIVSFCLTLLLLSSDKSKRLDALSAYGTTGRIIAVVDTLRQTPDDMHATIIRASSGADLLLSVSSEPQIKRSDDTPQVHSLQARFYRAGLSRVYLSMGGHYSAPRPHYDEHSASQGRALARRGTGHSMMDGSGSMMSRSGSMMSNSYSMMGEGSSMMDAYATSRMAVSGSVQLTNGQWLNFSSAMDDSATSWSTGVLLSLALVMLATILFSLWVIRRALRPVRELGRAAQSFAANKTAVQVQSAAPADLYPTIVAFNQMQQQLADYISERTKLLAAISHDLRTPLTSLRLRLEFIEESDDKQQMLRTINVMEKMIQATMQFAKNDAQSEARQLADIDSLMQTIVDEYADKQVYLDYEPVAQLVVNIPSLSVRRMTENLINNAIQYAGEDARITLQVSKHAHCLRVCVMDDGCGIEESKLAEVVKPFTRLNSARNTEGSSIGLGLSITQSLAQAYGGRLTLSNRQPHGLQACFEIQLDE